MGLLDSIQNFAASDEGMGLAQGLLSARGSAGLAAGLAGMNAAKEAAQLRQMRAMQVQQAQLAMDAQRRELARNQKLDELAPQFMRSPEQAQAMSMGPTQDGGSVAPVSPGFDFGGYANALAGIDPMKSISMQQALAKETQFNKIDPKDFTPDSIAKFAKTRDYGVLVTRDKKEVAPGGQVYNPFTVQEGSTLADANKPFAGFGPDGAPIANKPYQQYEFQKALAGKAVNNNTVINAGPKAFETELGKLDAEQLGKWREGANSAQNTLGIVQNLRDAEQKGAYSGGGANAKLAVASLVNGLTGVTPKGLVGSELFNSETNKLVLERVKALGQNPSNADREFIERTVPRLATSPQARADMTNFLEQKANQSIKLYKAADTHARANSGLKGFDELQFGQQSTSAPKTVVKQGMYGGKKVVQYSDGSVEYAN